MQLSQEGRLDSTRSRKMYDSADLRIFRLPVQRWECNWESAKCVVQVTIIDNFSKNDRLPRAKVPLPLKLGN